MRKHYRAILGIAVIPAVLGLAACGGGDDNSSSDSGGATAATTASKGDTVSTQSISGSGTVLVDSAGMALYTNDMDKGSKIACTGECVSEWVPVVVQGQPTSSDSAVQSKLGTVKRDDGSTQVTFNGQPLYTFVDDTAGQVTGDGEMDSFGGTTFTWTVASTGGNSGGGGGSGAAPSTTSSGSSSGGGSIGY